MHNTFFIEHTQEKNLINVITVGNHFLKTHLLSTTLGDP